jgi:hypothetical protein
MIKKYMKNPGSPRPIPKKKKFNKITLKKTTTIKPINRETGQNHFA